MALNEDQVCQTVQNYIDEHLCPPVPAKPDSVMVDDLNLDSLDAVELVMAMEERFALGIRDEDAEKCVTVRDLAHLICKS